MSTGLPAAWRSSPWRTRQHTCSRMQTIRPASQRQWLRRAQARLKPRRRDPQRRLVAGRLSVVGRPLRLAHNTERRGSRANSSVGLHQQGEKWLMNRRIDAVLLLAIDDRESLSALIRVLSVIGATMVACEPNLVRRYCRAPTSIDARRSPGRCNIPERCESMVSWLMCRAMRATSGRREQLPRLDGVPRARTCPADSRSASSRRSEHARGCRVRPSPPPRSGYG